MVDAQGLTDEPQRRATLACPLEQAVDEMEATVLFEQRAHPDPVVHGVVQREQVGVQRSQRHAAGDGEGEFGDPQRGGLAGGVDAGDADGRVDADVACGAVEHVRVSGLPYGVDGVQIHPAFMVFV